MFLSPLAFSNTLSPDQGDVSDVLAVIEKWAELEHDLAAQAELVRVDRVQIGGGIRQSNQAENLAVQLLRYNALLETWGGESLRGCSSRKFYPSFRYCTAPSTGQ